MDIQKLKDAYSKVSDDTKKAVRALFLNEDEPTETEEAETVTEEVEAALAEDQKFVEIPDEEGNVLIVEPDLQVGASVMLQDPATGDAIETPDASYTLADGTTLEVAGGEITAINPAEEVEEDMPEEEEEMAAEPTAEAREPKTITERTEVEKRFEAENNELKAELEKSNERLEELTNTVEEFKTLLAEFGALPTAEPVQEPKTPYSSGIRRAIELNKNTTIKTK